MKIGRYCESVYDVGPGVSEGLGRILLGPGRFRIFSELVVLLDGSALVLPRDVPAFNVFFKFDSVERSWVKLPSKLDIDVLPT